MGSGVEIKSGGGALGRKQAPRSSRLRSTPSGVNDPTRVRVGRWTRRSSLSRGSHHPCPPSFRSWALSLDSEVLRADHGTEGLRSCGLESSWGSRTLPQLPVWMPCPQGDLLARLTPKGPFCPFQSHFQDSTSFAYLPACSMTL